MLEARLNGTKAWLVSADMGYGHQRAIYPFKTIAEGEPITLGLNDGSLERERKLYSGFRKNYEFASRSYEIPVVKWIIFPFLNWLLNIPRYYPERDLSKLTLQVRFLSFMIKRGLGKGFLSIIKKRKDLPLLTSFYLPAIAADRKPDLPVFCIICDADINRVWVPQDSRHTRIHYLVPAWRSFHRLLSYGVAESNIHFTGFPLPLELTGGNNLEILKADLGQRLFYLDPCNQFFPNHLLEVEHALEHKNVYFRKDRLLTLTYAVGGAGAQKETGRLIALSLKKMIRKGKIRLNLVAGIRSEVEVYFNKIKNDIGSENIQVYYSTSLNQYFETFNSVLRTTDILWTKPSELSFYCGLGLPIIISEPIGPQENCNQQWLLETCAGINQQDPRYTHQWLFDLLERGCLAETAWAGFLRAPQKGTFKIMDLLSKVQ